MLSSQAWYALQVRQRREKHVGSLLNSKGYEVCVPEQVDSQRRVGEYPVLFPGYVLVRFDPFAPSSAESRVISTPGVIRLLTFGSNPSAISDTDIAALRLVVASGRYRSPFPYLSIGDAVQVIDGPLKGLTGSLRSIRNSHRIIVSIHMLQRSVSVDISTDSVVSLDTV
jgi:transcription antitermination factor NusG